MKQQIWLLLLPLFLVGCADTNAFDRPPGDSTSVEKDTSFNVIVFGSCNRQNLSQPIWGAIMEQNPDIWVWLGDNVYGDSADF